MPWCSNGAFDFITFQFLSVFLEFSNLVLYFSKKVKFISLMLSLHFEALVVYTPGPPSQLIKASMKESSDQKGGKLVCKQKTGLQFLSIFAIYLNFLKRLVQFGQLRPFESSEALLHTKN